MAASTESLRLENEREISSLSVDDVETACAKIFPVVRQRGINFARKLGWQNNKARTCLLHEPLHVCGTQRRSLQPSTRPTAKIPNQTRLVVIDRCELHFRTQVVA